MSGSFDAGFWREARVATTHGLEAHPETGLSEQGEFARRDPFGVRLP